MSKSPQRSFLAGFASAALALTASIGGCSSSSPASQVLGGAGESCTKTADCDSGLACIADVCATRGAIGVALMDGGVVFAPEAGPAPAAAADAGGGPEAAPPPRASDLGESCSMTADCGAGLVCVPAASGAGGTCDLTSYGLTPTGKTCSGECLTGADCCELPVGVLDATIRTCEDVLGALMGNTAQCATAVADSEVGIDCFVYATYCSTCATSNVWSCTANQCVYDLPCQNDGVELDGCPSETRTGRPLSTFCDTTASKCQNIPRGICDTSSDCDGKATTDGMGTCRSGDCTCYQGGCYISCASTLDCAQGYTCNAASKLCTQAGACSSDAQCATQTGVVNARCVSGACKTPCAFDRQCGGSGLATNGASDAGFGGKVCGTDGFCDDLGCASDADCQESGHNMAPGVSVNLFCVTPRPPTPTPAPASAITN